MYRPPHMRSTIPSAEGATGARRVQGTPFPPARPLHTSSPSQATGRPPMSKKDWNAPPRQTSRGSTVPGPGARAGAGPSNGILASPATDLKTRRSGTAVGGREVDEMEMLQSVSRSGGDGADGDALKKWDLQERFRAYIDEKLEAHYRTYHTTPDTVPASGSSEQENLGSIVLLLRKLREGVVASGRVDRFAIEVFETSAKLAILAKNTAQAISALSGLVPGLYRTVAEQEASRRELHGHHKGKGRAPSNDPETGVSEVQEGIGRLAVNITGQPADSSVKSYSDNRAEFASLLLLFHLCHSASTTMFHSTLIELTAPQTRSLRRPFEVADTNLATPARRPLSTKTIPQPAFLAIADLTIPIRAAQHLSTHAFNPIAYFRLLAPDGKGAGVGSISPYERAILQWAAPSVRDRAWEVMRRAYMEVRVRWAGELLGIRGEGTDGGDVNDEGREEVEGYVAGKGLTVERESGRIKLR